MTQAGPFLRRLGGDYMHWCPGCGAAHFIAVERDPEFDPDGKNPYWSYDGNEVAPTFHPSVRRRTPGGGDGTNGAPPEVCHYFIRAGKIEYCADSTHRLAGQTVDLTPWGASPVAADDSEGGA